MHGISVVGAVVEHDDELAAGLVTNIIFKLMPAYSLHIVRTACLLVHWFTRPTPARLLDSPPALQPAHSALTYSSVHSPTHTCAPTHLPMHTPEAGLITFRELAVGTIKT